MSESAPKYEPGKSKEALRATLAKASLDELLNLRERYWHEQATIGQPHESEDEKWRLIEEIIDEIADVEAAIALKQQQEESE